MNEAARPGARREADRRTERILEQHAPAFELRRWSVHVHDALSAIDLRNQHSRHLCRNTFADPDSQSVSRASKDELGT